MTHTTGNDGGQWVVNINVHGIGPRPSRALDDGEDQVWISVEQFDGLLDAVDGRSDVALTFDDGNRSDLEIGLPRLLERGLKARFYVCAGLLGEPDRLDGSDVRELHDAGMLIGSHGWAHRDWRRLDWGHQGSTQVQEEIVHARRDLERVTGTDVTEVAVPFGSYDRHVLRALRRAGASRVYTSDGGRARSSAWLQARTSIRADDGLDWPKRLVTERPRLASRARRHVARAAKRLRG